MSHLQRRQGIISKITNTLLKCKEEGLEADIKKLITAVEEEYGSSRQTSMDYIKVAMARVENIIEAEKAEK